MNRLLDPCPNCRRPMVDTRSGPEADSYYCWFCEERIARNIPLRMLSNQPVAEAL